ncbi:hypothetical protein [Nocardioides sp. KR10-350]|uniref:hypothetical protein n=1 Tax=Nocardioides cheoyonin TaxID=3156615 RepID=UPI0032B46D42
MSTDAPEQAPDTSRGPDPDYRLLVLAAIVPAVVIAAILIRILVDRPHDSNLHPATQTVTVPADAPASGCGKADADALAGQEDAVEATVTSVSGTTVTLEPKRVFKGERSQRIELQLPSATPAPALRLPTFQDGHTYLLAIATDGTLSGCGLTGEESGSLESLYSQAFG